MICQTHCIVVPVCFECIVVHGVCKLGAGTSYVVLGFSNKLDAQLGVMIVWQANVVNVAVRFSQPPAVHGIR
jgi:hypothetical protein